jgi:hypothetical protein
VGCNKASAALHRLHHETVQCAFGLLHPGCGA